MAVFKTTSAEVCGLLKKRFCAPEWALFFEVGDATGGRASRWADAVAMNLWPSRGLAINGFEIKVSRADWLGELRNPAKAEAIASKCDMWWLVAAEGVVQDGELPDTWGLLEVNARGLIQRKQAKQRLPRPELSREFLAALIRRAGQVDDAERRRLVEAETKRLRSESEDRIEREIKFRSARYSELQEAVDDFERASGLKISGWNGGADIGKAVAIVKRIGVDSIYSAARGVINQARSLADGLEKELTAVVPVEAIDDEL